MNELPQLTDFQAIFSPALQTFFRNYREQVAPLWPLAKDMFEKLAEFTLRGGKRTRPALLYYSYIGFSGKNPEKLLPLCVACELMQSFLLIHDDIMDQSDIRRGGKTIHQQFSDKRPYSGESMAILVGNLAGYLGLRAISDVEFEPMQKNQIMDLYSQICIDAGYGQALDISFETLDSLNEEKIYTIYRYKTARYTSEFPLLSAAILANQDEKTLLCIKDIAIDLGILFQIRDDILGLFGDDETTGKQSSLDLIQGKKTLLVCKAFEKSNTQQKQHLSYVYGNADATTDDIALAKKMIVDTGALFYADEMIKKRSARALNEIESLHLESTGEIFLKDLVQYCGNRNH